MKNSFIKAIISLILCVGTLFGSALSVTADGSHGFFMDCDAAVVDHKADGFMIDFYSDSDEALCTYWSNANWSMDTEMSSKLYGSPLLEGGAYAGLQLRGNQNDRTGIMSLWRYKYTDKDTGEEKYIYANALYGETTTYDNEGSGTSCVMPYPWRSGCWYRQLLLCWQDTETGKTFIGTWFYDYDEDKWTLFAYYNTQLIFSYIKGDIGQFLENYAEREGARYRSFRYRNVYFLSHEKGEWISSPTISIRSDGNPKAFGEAKLGISEDGTYVWASVDGTSSTDTDHTLSLKPTLVQNDKPTLGTPEIGSAEVKTRQNGKDTEARLTWKMAEHSTPQLSYNVIITDANGKTIKKAAGTRPEVNMIELSGLKTDAYKCEITVTDVFGQNASATYYSENYPKKDPSATDPGDTAKPQSTQKPDSGFPILPVALTGSAVVVIALVAIILIKRKKGAESKA